mmetsp:Transcript_127775/g.367826  ORF Transcript_127775/g.367826 Transcript_127775/m.367826 type:complete len:226 (+) Transcript_127775:73-750(+)
MSLARTAQRHVLRKMQQICSPAAASGRARPGAMRLSGRLWQPLRPQFCSSAGSRKMQTPFARLTLVRHFSEGKADGKDGGKAESDRRFDESGEYDTQEKYKRIGNPIQWANPTGGGSQLEDNSSKHWRWVYPVGAGLILLICLYSRRKNLRKEQDEQVINAPNIKPIDASRFTMPAYRTPEPVDEDDGGENVPPPSAAVGGGGFDFGGPGGLAPPPASGQGQSAW